MENICRANDSYFRLFDGTITIREKAKEENMGVYYSIYAEARVGNKWYSINPMIRNENDEVRAYPVMSGQSQMREAVENMEEDCYMRGCPENLSDELNKIYGRRRDQNTDSMWNNMTYGDYYNQTLFLVNYGKHVKSRVKSEMPTRYRGYVNKHCLAEYEIGNIDDLGNWLTEDEYRDLSDDERKKYTYYEWNEWDDWYGVYVELVRRVDCLLTFFKEWSFIHIHDADLDEKDPTADYVCLIVSRE